MLRNLQRTLLQAILYQNNLKFNLPQLAGHENRAFTLNIAAAWELPIWFLKSHAWTACTQFHLYPASYPLYLAQFCRWNLTICSSTIDWVLSPRNDINYYQTINPMCKSFQHKYILTKTAFRARKQVLNAIVLLSWKQAHQRYKNPCQNKRTNKSRKSWRKSSCHSFAGISLPYIRKFQDSYQ